jgi:hypothetical protein
MNKISAACIANAMYLFTHLVGHPTVEFQLPIIPSAFATWFSRFCSKLVRYVLVQCNADIIPINDVMHGVLNRLVRSLLILSSLL